MKYLKDYRFWLLLGLSGIVVGSALYLYRVNSKWARFEKIKPGMAQAEVVDLMGKDYFEMWSMPLVPPRLAWEEDATLLSHHYRIEVDFDNQRRVTAKYRQIIEPSHFRGFLDSLGW